MKLSKEQINALANKVYNDLKAAHDKKIKPFVLSNLNEIQIKRELNKYKEVFKLIDEGIIADFSIPNSGYYKNEISLKKSLIIKIEHKYKNEQFFKINMSEIVNSIILNTIEAKDLNDLITKLNKEFSK